MKKYELARYEVIEEYYGLFDSERVICTTISIDEAAYIIDNMVANKKGRPITYRAHKISKEYVEEYDLLETWTPSEDFCSEWDQDSYQKYIDGISCLNQKPIND